MGAVHRFVATACLVVVVGACDREGFVSEAPAGSCTAVGARCQLVDGPLGVCESAPCPAGSPPPCLVCTPQH